MDGSSRSLSTAGADWSGVWFRLLAERGEDIEVRVGLVHNDDDGDRDRVVWAGRPHTRCDGLGAVASVLADAGLAVAIPPSSAPRGLAVRLHGLVQLLRLALTPPSMVDLWPRCGPHRGAPTVVHLCLGEAETTTLLARARADGGTLTALLLWRLADALRPHLHAPALAARGDALTFMVPVNLRGLVRPPTDALHGNQVGFVVGRVAAGDDVAAVRAGLVRALQRGQAFATWAVNQVGRVVGLAGMRALVRLPAARAFHHVATVSNLGALAVTTTTTTPTATAVAFAPPVAFEQPFALGAVTVGGRLTLTATAHPSLTLMPEALAAILQACTRPSTAPSTPALPAASASASASANEMSLARSSS